MGGEREEVIKTTPGALKAGPDGTIEATDDQPQTIRFHESKGEVHFHDDERKLKAAVPVARWWRAWEDLKTMVVNDFRFIDAANTTVLSVFVFSEAGEDSQCAIKAEIRLEKLTGTNEAFQKLDRFTGSR